MNMLRTARTYKTQANALKALDAACGRLGVDIEVVRYIIAVNEDGRFAPVVIYCGGTLPTKDGGEQLTTAFCHVGVTVVS